MTTQSEFRAGLLDAAQPVPEGLLDGHAAAAGRRYAVYQNNVTVSLIEAMKTAFPLVRKLIGTENFDNLVPLFVRAHPPSSPLMMFYGVNFPAFIAEFAPLSHIGYLADAARLDLAMRTAYHAADAKPLDPNQLQNQSEEAIMNAQFRLAPATQIVHSAWPLHDIWRYNFADNAPKPRAIAQDVIITRAEFDPAPHAPPIGTADWLTRLRAGETLLSATELASAAHPEFALAASLTFALSTHVFTDITLRDQP